MSYESMKLNELSELLDNCRESHAENYAQYRFEMAAYGDAWPGSAIELAEDSADIAKMQAAVESKLQGPMPYPPIVCFDDDYFTAESDDIPF